MWHLLRNSLLIGVLVIPSAWAQDDAPRLKLIPELGDWSTSTVPDLTSSGTVTGTNVAFTGLISCDTIDTDANGNMFCGTDSTGAEGGGDSVTVNSAAIDTTANFLDGDIDWTLVDGGGGGPDDITGTVACSGCVDSTDISNDSIVNADINSVAAIVISKTALVAGTNITLSTNTLNVDDAFIVNNADDDMDGVLTANGLTLAANENITLGSQTLDHNGTDFVFNDSINVDASSSTVTGTIVAAVTEFNLGTEDYLSLTGRSLTNNNGTLEADAETYTDTKCYRLTHPVAEDDDESIWRNSTDNNFQLTRIWAESDQTVTFNLQVDDDSPANVMGASLAPAAGEAEDLTLSGDTVVGTSEELDLVIDSVASAPTWFNVCWTGTWVD